MPGHLQTAKTLWGIALAPRSRLVKDFLEFLEVKPTKGVSATRPQ